MCTVFSQRHIVHSKPIHLLYKRNTKAYTIMELMVVLGTVAVLAGVGGLTYLSMRSGLALGGASRQIMGDLMAARMRAVNQNNEFKVFFLNDHEYKILDDDDGKGDVDVGEATELRDIHDSYPEVTFSATDDPVFSPRGTAKAGTTVTLSNGSGTKIVRVSTTGRIKIE